MKLAQAFIFMALTAIATMAAAPRDCGGTVVFEDDFESYEVGSAPEPTWYVFTDKGGTAEVVDGTPIGGDGNALQTTVSGSPDIVLAGLFFTPITSKVVLTLDVYRESDGLDWLDLRFGATEIKFRGPNLTFEGHPCGVPGEQQWHTIELTIDLFASNMDLAIDGELNENCSNLDTGPIQSLDSFYVEALSIEEGVSATTLVDNIRIKEFDE
ncbi:MAG: hypothetical protein H6684_10245 [Deltaproteobacteria bacterium]|nr:hypothetical protein [Deltaproteobacteria bacterium]MCB9489098.1 hypothetical protein [Deltaproteobacteria bacterium]